MNNSKKRIFLWEVPQISQIYADKTLSKNLRDLREILSFDIFGQILDEFVNRIELT